MSSCQQLSTSQILSEFTAEIGLHGGTVRDAFDDGQRLFARSVLPATQFVQRDDGLQGGVALRATEESICVHPYLFRQVCTNGAITAHTVGSWELSELWLQSADGALASLREAVAACCSEEAFSQSVRQMQSALRYHADLAISLMPMVSRMPGHHAMSFMRSVMERFMQSGDRSRFGLINAVTSLARDTIDPEHRWRLEELGGALILETSRSPKPDFSPLAARPPRSPVGAY